MGFVWTTFGDYRCQIVGTHGSLLQIFLRPGRSTVGFRTYHKNRSFQYPSLAQALVGRVVFVGEIVGRNHVICLARKNRFDLLAPEHRRHDLSCFQQFHRMRSAWHGRSRTASLEFERGFKGGTSFTLPCQRDFVGVCGYLGLKQLEVVEAQNVGFCCKLKRGIS